ncbi:MBL fold metallo-hydrolase [Acidilobus sp.]|uniref:MBL fold metallo-hydrolase n=1 Tax=Acidilobus sp. TaxID=1872109 RepID=UPI003D0355EF
MVRAGPFDVSILAADSMGVRSIATVAEACGVRLGIDLGASLAPRRYGLPPHQLELQALHSALERIAEEVSRSDAIIITHYHYDHYLKDRPDLYYGKRLLVKDPNNNINWSQRGRARRFLVEGKVEQNSQVSYADGQTFRVGGLTLEFSPPVWHGEPGTKVGRLIMVRASCDGESIIFASDSQGPADPQAIEQLKSWAGARLLVLSGPPTYFAGFKVPVEAVQRGLDGLMELIKARVADTVVVDHHLLRDLSYREKLKEHYRAAEEAGVRLLTAAELMGAEVNQLEARRRELWGREGKGEAEESDYYEE